MELDVAIDVAAPRATVWDVLTRWEAQSSWMLDAKAVEVVTPHREGTGVTIHVPTNLLGVTVLDVMRVTDWDPPRRLEIVHLGRLIRGSGAFELDEHAGITSVHWWERIDPPLGRLGEWGARTVALPFIRRIFGQSLRNLAVVAEREHRSRRSSP